MFIAFLFAYENETMDDSGCVIDDGCLSGIASSE